MKLSNQIFGEKSGVLRCAVVTKITLKIFFNENKDKLVIKSGVHYDMIKCIDAPKGYNLMSNI